MEKYDNILKNPRIKRTVQYNGTEKQITINDQRFYRRNDKLFYPSVTYVLNYFPKNKYFEDWLKDVGHNAEFIAGKAAKEGTMVHDACEKYLKGEELVWIDETGFVHYPTHVWQMILKFVDFWETSGAELVHCEYHIFSDEYRYAGTIDLVVWLDGKLQLLDIKTSNSIHTTMELQLAAYAQAWNETHDTKIEDTGIIWLKAKTTKASKKDGKLSGRGWELKRFDRTHEQAFEIFKGVYQMWTLENPNPKPWSEKIAISVQMKKKDIE